MYFDFWRAVDDYNKRKSWSTHLVDTTPDESTLYVSMPGYGRDDITVEVNGGQLTISGALPEERCVTDLIPRNIHHSFSVSTAFRIDEAVLENGILAVKLVRHNKAEPIKIPLK
jgi:HSP20 family molecular chaperone IbpA